MSGHLLPGFALKCFSEANRIEPDNVVVLYNLGNCLAKSGKNDFAIPAVAIVPRDDPPRNAERPGEVGVGLAVLLETLPQDQRDLLQQILGELKIADRGQKITQQRLLVRQVNFQEPGVQVLMRLHCAPL